MKPKTNDDMPAAAANYLCPLIRRIVEYASIIIDSKMNTLFTNIVERHALYET